MLDTDTKRRIDTARDILVGKVPDPKSQVEQITIALIYKFMDDIDAESEELGGKRSFFAGDFARYGWAKLMRAGLGGHETLNLYAEGITSMAENPGIPPLFRTIFNNAYLPYRDPETLRAFLKTIDEFSYADSENLGDAYEYLLSVLGTQGKLGQFRTPRHIIDFIVAVVDPKKDETVLDPACGTAGFLISAYKHILAANTDEDGHSTLTPDERSRIAGNFRGYDIDPGMVRFSLVNMYLHEFNSPTIDEYDTLTSDERWNEHADVILANPPFMNPTGGIRPHSRFSVQSKQSVVLFVDYMAQHLSPNGRAGFIVSEGMVFQSQNAHRQLRKVLVEDYLVAVVSLPAGVFKPYSGVKTSILFLDRALAKKSDNIAFFKVENDGFDLGDQRRPIDSNDLPQVQTELARYLRSLRANELLEGLDFGPGTIVNKTEIASNEDYSLSFKGIRGVTVKASQFPTVPLSQISRVIPGQSPPGRSYNGDGIGAPFYQGKTEFGRDFIGAPTKWTTEPKRFAEVGDILMSVRAPVGPVNLTSQKVCIGRGLAAIRPDSDRVLTPYVFRVLLHLQGTITGTSGAAFSSINKAQIENIQIPLPPLEVQQEIVAEIEGYQKVIDGARAVIDNYRPHIPINPDWPKVRLGDLCKRILSGGTPSTKEETYWKGDIPWITSANITDLKTATPQKYITEEAIRESATNVIPRGNVIVVTRVGLGKLFTNSFDVCISQDSQGLILRDKISSDYLVHVLKPAVERFKEMSQGTTIQGVTKKQLSDIEVPLPSFQIQQDLAVEISAEQGLIDSNRKLIERFERKIQDAVARVWGESVAKAQG